MKLAARAALLVAVAGGALAQGYPNRPITLTVPFAAGGPTDVVARSLGQAMAKTLGQTVVIENRLGAGGTIAATTVARAAPEVGPDAKLTSEGLRSWLQAETDRYGPMIKKAGAYGD